jgi:hypothetical protein
MVAVIADLGEVVLNSGRQRFAEWSVDAGTCEAGAIDTVTARARAAAIQTGVIQ